jgi:two-component system cell cycle response regulator
VENNAPHPPLWKRVWSPPEPEISEAGFSGELLIAGCRLLLVLVLVFIPAQEYIGSVIHDADDRDPRALLAAAGVGLLGALMIYAATRRHRGRSWIGFASSLLDVSLVSGTLAMLVLLGRPHEATNNLVIFPVYFLALGATSLRYDARICLVTGALALLQYAAIAAWAAVRWDSGLPPLAWSDQGWRLAHLAGATALSTTVVVRSRELRLLSTRDRFTGLLNRAVFNEQLEREVAFARREAARFAVAMVDIDHFKRFNDTYGHAGGDEALRLVAATLRNTCRESDVVARYGGEEFALILPGVRSGRAHDLLERFRRVVVATPIHLTGRARPVSVTISIGVASFPEDGVTATEVLACADRRLYEAKNTGRDRVVGPPRAIARPASQRGDEDSQEILTSAGPIVPPDM